MRQTFLLFLGLFLLTGCSSASDDPSGPRAGEHFRAVSPHGQVTPIKPGKTVTDSFEKLRLQGDRPARILDVTSHGGESSLKMIGTMVAGPERKLENAFQYRTYPPSKEALGATPRPAVGAVIQPVSQTRARQGWQLLVGYRFVGKALAARTYLSVTYSIDGRVFRQKFPSTLVACPRQLIDRPTCGNYGRAAAEKS